MTLVRLSQAAPQIIAPSVRRDVFLVSCCPIDLAQGQTGEMFVGNKIWRRFSFQR